VVIRVVLEERKGGAFSFGLSTATALAQNTLSMEARESSICSWGMSTRVNFRLSFLVLSKLCDRYTLSNQGHRKARLVNVPPSCRRPKRRCGPASGRGKAWTWQQACLDKTSCFLLNKRM